MAKMKWDLNGRGVTAKQPGEAGGGYDGPDLPKGSWPVRIKRMEVMKIGQNKKASDKKGPNDGKPRIRILMEVVSNTLEGKEKYHGHPIWDGLNVIESSVSFVNGFLHALTDGSEAGKRAIEAQFWDDDKGPDFKRIKNDKSGAMETHITKIGKAVINSPKGEYMLQVTTRGGKNLDGSFKAEVTGYLPFKGKQADPDDDGEDYEDEEDELLSDDVDDDEVDDDDDSDDTEYVDDEDDSDEDEDGDDEVDDEDGDDEEPEEQPVKASGRSRKPF